MTSLRSARLAGVLGLVAGVLSAPAAPLFDYRDERLPNGLRVLTLEDFSCPIVAVHLWYHVGSKDENPERQGFAHMFEHMMFRGTDRLGPTDHFDYIRRTGGDTNAYTAFDQTVYVQTLPANQLELALWLEAERMSFLKIDQTSFDTERKVVEEERRLGVNQPYGTIPEKALAEIFKVHPYRWLPIGSIPHLRAASVPELREFWTRYYVPNNATLVIAGAVKHADALQAAQKYFGWIPRYEDPPSVTAVEPDQSEARNITFKEDNAPAPVVGCVFRTVPAGHPDALPLRLLGTILGGGESSRIYRELVAEKSMAVVAAAMGFSIEQSGLFAAGAVMPPFGGDPKAVQAALAAQLERLRNEPVSAAELEKARNQMLAETVSSTLTVESKATLLGTAAVVEGDVSRVNRRLEEVRQVTAADLQRVAQTYLAPQRATNITVERNLLGVIFGKKNNEDAAPITGVAETTPPPPGRLGLTRPAGFPTAPPIAGLLDQPEMPKYTKTRLSNGMNVIVVANKEVPYVTMQLGIEAGAWTDSKPGTAEMTLGMLTKGTRSRTEAQIAEELESHGITLGGDAGLDSASVVVGCVTEQVERALTILTDVVRNPTFPEDEFDKHRTQVRTGLAISSAEPSYIADRELRRRMYGKHPYGRTETGEPSDLDALAVEDVRTWWSRFARPDLMTLIFAGDIDTPRALELTRKQFGEWEVTTALPDLSPEPAPPTERTHIYLVDRPIGVQSQIRVGQVQPWLTRHHQDYPTTRVVSGYFGEAFNARLNETIRVKMGLTYGARGGYSARNFMGQFVASTFSKNETTAAAVQAIFDELKRLRSEPASDEELNHTKSYLLGSFVGDRETPQQVAGDLWLIQSQGLPDDYLSRFLTGVAQTNRDECLRVAQGTVDPERMIVVVVGPAEKLRSELEQIAPVTVLDSSGNVSAPAGESNSQQ